MAGEINPERGDAFYNQFYLSGGWKYSFWKEFLWHRRHIVKPFRLKRGMTMLEVACGSGFHTNLFRWMGFDCTGVDRSEGGIAWAKRHYPRASFECCDLREMPFDKTSFDVILARGCSHYHYDQQDPIALDTTARLARYLKPGGVFIMTIATDLSGRKESGKIWQNELDDYRRHFSSFGKKWSVDWAAGMVICGLHNAPAESPSDLDETTRPTLVPAT